jgi:hypothetical protein
MIYKDSKTSHPPVCNFLPGYPFYSSMGYGMAESLVNIIEWLLGLRR